ncbi:MAG: ABC transporter permease [Bacillota bacterium]|nr:ABC transporter permease [Bacillota bacterium]
MRRYVIRRIIVSILILLLVALLIYTILRCIPSSYVENMARERATQPGSKSYAEWLAQLNAVYGLDSGIIEGFFRWLGAALRGDFGDSWYYNVPVAEKFTEVIWYSFVLAALGFILVLLIAVPLGVTAARHQYSWRDNVLTVLALIGISLPAFFFATLLKWLFAVKLQWLPLFGAVGRYYQQLSGWQQFWDLAAHFVLPVATLVIVSVGGLMRFTRVNMLEVLDSDYIRAARAKGLPESRVISRHAFRNTLLPLVTIAGASLPTLFAGALIIETLFQIPGIGWTAYQAMVAGDIPFSMFYLLFIAVLTLLGALLADICYALADPRVRVGGGEG